ncbi:MAG: hypothetical protein WC455_10610 [Dehalococcoidia bacterium]|jgi:hypothetical protein
MTDMERLIILERARRLTIRAEALLNAYGPSRQDDYDKLVVEIIDHLKRTLHG